MRCWACRKAIKGVMENRRAVVTEIRVRLKGGYWTREVPFHQKCFEELADRTAPKP